MAWGGTLKPSSTLTGNNTHKRLIAIDMMVGMSMIFVVLGHLSVGNLPQWYTDGLRNWLYSFHMQMFVFLSAFLIRYTYKEVKSTLEYCQYIWRKFKKFFIWFFVIGIAVALIACPVNGTPLTGEYLRHTIRNLFLYPRFCKASFLWYIYILLGYYIISPLFFRLPGWAKVVCCIGTMFLPMLDAGHLLAAYDFCQYTFFYCLGVLCAEWIEEIRNARLRFWVLLALPFAAFTAWIFGEAQFLGGFSFTQLGWWTLVTGTAALPFFYLLAMALQKNKAINKTLTLISKDCYWIYLMQMFVVWGIAIVLINSGHLNSIPFAPFMVVTTILAIAIPILLAEAYKRLFHKK